MHRVAKMPPWDHTLLSSWWRYIGHLARSAHREPDRWIDHLPNWRGEAYRRLVRELLLRQAIPHAKDWTAEVGRLRTHCWLYMRATSAV